MQELEVNVVSYVIVGNKIDFRKFFRRKGKIAMSCGCKSKSKKTTAKYCSKCGEEFWNDSKIYYPIEGFDVKNRKLFDLDFIYDTDSNSSSYLDFSEYNKSDWSKFENDFICKRNIFIGKIVSICKEGYGMERKDESPPISFSKLPSLNLNKIKKELKNILGNKIWKEEQFGIYSVICTEIEVGY